MADPDSSDETAGPIARNWRRTAVLVVALAAFLGVYDAVRNKGRLFLCDLAGLVGQQNLIVVCRKDEAPPNEGDLLANLEFLKAREDQLSDERLAQLRRLEIYFEDQAFTKLSKAAGLQETPDEVEAEAATREAVRETVEEGSPEERKAIALIAEGDVQGGLQLLSDLASASTQDTAEQWRRIGRLAYPVDTTRARDAYEKVVALDQSDAWDAIYLGRLHVRAGALAEARRLFSKALSAQPEERDRSVLLNEIGNVQFEQGDLGSALTSYRASLEIAEQLADQDRGNASWQRDLSVSHEKIGDVEELLGNLAEAIVAYEASLPIAESLADRFPDHPQFQSDIVITRRRLEELRRAAQSQR